MAELREWFLYIPDWHRCCADRDIHANSTYFTVVHVYVIVYCYSYIYVYLRKFLRLSVKASGSGFN